MRARAHECSCAPIVLPNILEGVDRGFRRDEPRLYRGLADILDGARPVSTWHYAGFWKRIWQNGKIIVSLQSVQCALLRQLSTRLTRRCINGKTSLRRADWRRAMRLATLYGTERPITAFGRYSLRGSCTFRNANIALVCIPRIFRRANRVSTGN